MDLFSLLRETCLCFSFILWTIVQPCPVVPCYGGIPPGATQPLPSDDSVKVDHFYQQASALLQRAPDSSRTLLEKGLRLADSIGYVKGRVNILSGLGYYGIVTGNASMALRYLNLAMEEAEMFGIESAEKSGNANQQLQVLGVLANTWSSLKEYQAAERYYLEVIRLARDLNSSYNIALTCGNLGLTLFLQGKTDEAIPYFREAVRIFEEMDAMHYLVSPYANLAKCYASKGRFREAMEWARKAETTAAATGSAEKKAWALEAFVAIYEKQLNYREANEILHRLLVIKDSIYSIEQKEKIAEMETRFSVRQKEQEIALLKQESEIRQLEIGAKRQSIRYLIAGLIKTDTFYLYYGLPDPIFTIKK